eukprot:4645-Heterococcus_DN1.PRE.1
MSVLLLSLLERSWVAVIFTARQHHSSVNLQYRSAVTPLWLSAIHVWMVQIYGIGKFHSTFHTQRHVAEVGCVVHVRPRAIIARFAMLTTEVGEGKRASTYVRTASRGLVRPAIA